MKELFSLEQLHTTKSKEKLPFECEYCGNKFLREKKIYLDVLKNKRSKISFCSNSCSRLALNKKMGFLSRKNVTCRHCGIDFTKAESHIKKTKNNFCSRSCAATYNNTHKTKGNRRSKLEKWLEEQLTSLYPDLQILYSDKTVINSELDIYIPSLKLAFELNGIFHYEPIFGDKKLEQIQNNDNRKFQACLEKNIELCIIDVSSQKYFKPQTSRKFLDIINNIINIKNQNPLDGIEPS